MKINNSLHARRKFLQKAAVLTGTAFLLPFSSATAQSLEVETVHLADKLLLVKGPDSNVLAVASDEGIIMVDGGHASWFESLHQAIGETFPDSSVRALFNTHWHREQTGSNEAMGMQGVEILAHDNTRLWLSTEVWQRWSDMVFPPLPQVALPNTVFLDSDSIQIAEHNIRIEHLWNAHTDGDIAVYFEQENVLACGGLVSNGRWPLLDWWTGGYTGGLLESFVSLLSIPNSATKIIPAYGDVMTFEQLQAQNRMYVTIVDRLHELYIQSYSLEEMLAAKPTAQYDAEMGDPTQFITLAFQGLERHLRDPQNFRLLNLP